MAPAAVRLVALVAVAACLLPPVGAKAVPVEGVIQSVGPGTFLGENRFVGEATAFLQEPGPEAAPFVLAWPGGTVRRINLPTEEVWSGSGASGQKVLLPGPGEAETWSTVEAMQLRFAPAPAPAPAPATTGSHSRIFATASPFTVDLSPHRALAVTLASPLQHTPARPPFGGVDAVDGQPVAPAGPLGFATVDGHGPSWSEPFAALLTGGQVEVGGTSWATGRWLNASRSAIDPVTGSGRYVFDNVVVVAEGRGGQILWEAPGGWALALTRLSGALAGDAAWTGVDATVRAAGRPLPADIDLFHLRGDLELQATFGEAAHWTVAGEATFVAVDGRLTAAASAAAVAGGLGLAALAWMLWSRGGLAFLLGRTGARLTKADPLASPGRRKVLAAIHGLQPADRAVLQQATGLSRTAVAYHLRILVAYEILQVAPGRPGAGAGDRSATYVLNSGSMSFHLADGLPAGTQAGEEGVLVSRALAAANSHPVRRRLYALLLAMGRADFPALAAAWEAHGHGALPQSSATHHLQMLVRAGALGVVREGHRKVYAPAVDPVEARVQQYRRFLGQVRGLDVVRALGQRGPLAEPDLLSLVDERRPREARRRIGRLAELGILRFDPAHSRYDVEEFLKPCVARL